MILILKNNVILRNNFKKKFHFRRLSNGFVAISMRSHLLSYVKFLSNLKENHNLCFTSDCDMIRIILLNVTHDVLDFTINFF